MLNHLIALFIPLIITNVLHMVVVKRDYFAYLCHPINQKLFGKNKTYRGVFFVTTINAIIYYLLFQLKLIEAVSVSIPQYYIGALLGLAYVLAELPNSFIKRRLKVAAGESATRNRVIFMLMDKMDSSLAVSICYSFLFDINFLGFITLFLTAFSLHLSISYLLTLIKIKKSL